MTVNDLFFDTRGRIPPMSPEFNSNPFADTWRHDPRSNPGLSAANDDYRLLENNLMVQELADQLLKKNQVARASDQATMLKALLQQPRVNLFSAPTSPTESAAQKIVQEHINAGQRGVSSYFATQAARKRDAIEAQNWNIAARNQAMKEAQFRMDQSLRGLNYRDAVSRQNDLNKYREDQVAAQAQARQQSAADRQATLQQRDYERALHLIENEGATPQELMGAFPNLSNEHFMALDAAAGALARGDQQQFDMIKKLAQDRTDELNQKVYQAESDYLAKNEGRFSTVPEDVLMKKGQAAREEYLAQFGKDKNASKSIYFDDRTGAFVPIGDAPKSYTPLDRAMLARRRVGMPSSVPVNPLPVPRDGIPVVRSPQEVSYFSDYPKIRSTDGRVKLNPLYRQRQPSAAPRMNPTGGNYGDYVAPTIGDFAY